MRLFEKLKQFFLHVDSGTTDFSNTCTYSAPTDIVGTDSGLITNDDFPDSDVELMSKDLMVYIGDAITQWSRQYHMDKMPKHLIFKKALTLMNAWDRNSVFKE